MSVPDSLLRPHLRRVMLELTTRCNLRCTYCAVSHPDYRPKDLSFDARAVASSVAWLRPHEVQISGHGETTIADGWLELARDLLELGYPLSITSNLAKRLRDDEVEALARFASITVSCDSPDPETFAAIRRGGRLEKVEENLARIARAADPDPRKRPYIALNCVLSDRNVTQLPDLVDWAADRDLECVSLTHLVSHEALIGEAPGHPTRVPGAAGYVERARERARARGLDFNVMGGLEEALRERQG